MSEPHMCTECGRELAPVFNGGRPTEWRHTAKQWTEKKCGESWLGTVYVEASIEQYEEQLHQLGVYEE